jgi:hypothetical protein
MTTDDEDPVAALSVALAQANATPRINRKRIVPSTLHDANYHLTIIACAMRIHAKESTKRVLAPWLKLLQFVAARPSLVGDLVEYSKSRRQGDLHQWSLMPRGYLGDQTHDGVVDFLVAAEVLRRDGDCVEAGPRYSVLEAIALQVEDGQMFVAERNILNRLLAVKPNRVMLGGS